MPVKQSRPKVSVVVPIYNGEQFVDSCCEQLASQTLTEIEVILVDDGSTDSTGSLCDAAQDYFSFVVAVHQEHAGVSAARNRGISLAQGEYIAFVDVDDEFEPDMLEFEYDLAISTGADVVCLDLISSDPDETVFFEGPERALECLLDKKTGLAMSWWEKKRGGGRPCFGKTLSKREISPPQDPSLLERESTRIWRRCTQFWEPLRLSYVETQINTITSIARGRAAELRYLPRSTSMQSMS